MCQKLPYCARRIDPCIKDEVESINNNPKYRTLLCCCGHHIYEKTIICFNRKTKDVFEWYSGIVLSHGIRKRKRYYKKDKKGFYYIPELTMNR
jgi:hypothetical protein